MNLPPFPSQDLAKLVLGYLAEEQLMTAYDEFLQASPYLDALRNEYDRIFMTSLKSILAEYRAVKICVETCKPFILRKRIFQCPNLLEIVKFLISIVDINKLQLLEAADKASYEKQNISTKTCDVCSSLKLSSCICKSKQTHSTVSQRCNVETSQNSVEATPLTDLPGNYVTTRKKLKTLEKESAISNSDTSSAHHSDCSVKDSQSSSTSEQSVSLYQSTSSKCNDTTAPSLNPTIKPIELLDSRQKLEEFNNVLKSVVKRNSTISGSQICESKVSKANTFQDFASGVTGGDNQSANVPDSSTSENLNVQSITKDNCNDNIKGPPKRQLLLQVSHVNDNINIQTCRAPLKYPKILPKQKDDQKIKILSDVKVINQSDKFKEGKKKPVHFKNATSTPLMQMQTIVINGTPAYKNNTLNNHTYTKDEIMAMPTLIVVPRPGSSKNPASSQTAKTESCNVVSNDASSTSSVFGPLVIDVPSSPPIYEKPNLGASSDLNTHNPSGSNLVKTVDAIKNASAPKDTGTSSSTVATNTPQNLLPLRKSSSTPRRSSHVRVLDFTTPRRILHEAINEHATETAASSLEIVLSSSSDLTQTFTTNTNTTSETTVINYNSSSVPNVEYNSINDTIKNNTCVKLKKTKRDWDADLRALAVANAEAVCAEKPKKNPRKQKPDKISESSKEKKSLKQHSPKVKKNKRRRKVIEIDDEPPQDQNNKSTVPIKPIINVISGNNGGKMVDTINSKNDNENVNKSNEKEDGLIDTPDGERLSLQNVIGAKLNISELLETPYKQALYDIQMETPRFLGPDLPDDPMSDIKIMNIPTPRFLNTPKVVQATPSSHSSRPTDYSSGGSYYKPDEQDYIVLTDVACPVTSTKDTISINDEEKEVKKTRPVRQCAKNVSYYRSTGAVKLNNCDDKSDTASSSDESITLNSANDTKSEKENSFKTPSSKRSKSRILPDSNKKSTTKKRPSTKDKSKSFMKIKPRQTPTKLVQSGRIKRNSINTTKYTSPNKLARKRTTSKEKNVRMEPLLVSAPTKSRRKSSTPRKIDCTKTFNSANFRTNYPESNKQDNLTNLTETGRQDSHISSTEIQKQSLPRDVASSHDSDTDQLALRWSDDGSQDTKAKEPNESEDISKIKQYIETTNTIHKPIRKDGDGSLQADLVKRGFDVETAKIIERDLLDMPPQPELSNKPPQLSVEIVETKESSLEKTIETDVSGNNELQIVQGESEDEDVIEFSVHECNEDTNNYLTFDYDDTKQIPPSSSVTLKDNFSMEICIEDLTVRLRANQYTTLFDQEPVTVDEIEYNRKETEMAVSSIDNMERLYTPLKASIKAQCFEIFDSTLTSLDTPLKTFSPKRKDNDTTVTELLEEEKDEFKDKTDTKKRKRSVPDDSSIESKKPKHDTQYLLASTNIQNIDIESVLKKLHGP